MVNLSDLNKEDTYSIALLLLFVSNNNNRYSTLSELPYIFDHDNFMRFISYYEGQTITIPTQDEILKTLRILLLYQKYVVEQIGWRDALIQSGFTQEETYTAQRLLTSFKKTIEDNKIGDILNGSKR